MSSIIFLLVSLQLFVCLSYFCASSIAVALFKDVATLVFLPLPQFPQSSGRPKHLQPRNRRFFSQNYKNATFDYVVVGGGTAGLAVAMRLAEDPSYTVAVVEAGGFYQIENGNLTVVPAYNVEFAAINDLTANPTVDWGFVTTPQAGANNRTLHYARGKTLGGCSALNANIVSFPRGLRLFL